MRNWQKRTLFGLGSLAIVLVISGAIFEQIMRQKTAQKYPAPGKLVDIGGRKIQLDCRGSGSPTVVLESGLDNLGSLSWVKVHDRIAKITRVCAYSRAGMLWSDPAPGNFDRHRAAQDLHTALTNGGERKLGSRPLIVLTAMQTFTPEDLKNLGITEAQARKLQSTWQELQTDEATWSSYSRQQNIPNSSHYIQLDRPDVVINAVGEVVNNIRQQSKSR
jgi:hypothetical protein